MNTANVSPWVRVVALAAGECLNLQALTQRGGRWRVQTYPAGFALILHPGRGPVLFDTGYAPRVKTLMRRWPGALYGLVTPVRIEAQETAAAWVARLGWAPADIREVIVSHLHADHVGGLRDFPNAKFVLDAGAYTALQPLRGVRAVRRAFLPQLLPDDFVGRIQPLSFQAAPPGLEPLTEAADVFGDGSVLAVRVPGHAPGMIALIARSSPQATWTGNGTGLTLLAADAAWSVRGLREGMGVHPLARAAFWDVKQEAQSAARLREWLALHPRTQVIVSHDAPEPGRA